MLERPAWIWMRSCGAPCAMRATSRARWPSRRRAMPLRIRPGPVSCRSALAWCCRCRWCCLCWAIYSASIGCCLPGRSFCWRRRCSSSWGRVSTRRAGMRSRRCRATWICWWPSAPARALAFRYGCGPRRIRGMCRICISRPRPW
ncbi:hypothetical protein SDC9_102577 [bioreactor metagenome]|uniref:Uncharacterized protein n=1 Tax=bioreactor metagenome TaxID=1076179 RepID=A0A645ARQ5_9ZZZZ